MTTRRIALLDAMSPLRPLGGEELIMFSYCSAAQLYRPQAHSRPS